MDNVENNGLNPEMVEAAARAVADTEVMEHPDLKVPVFLSCEQAEMVAITVLTAAGVPGLVAEVERLRDVAHTLANEAEQREDEGRAAEQERDEFERRYSTVLRNLNAAQQERDAWRAVVEAVQTLVMAHTDSDGLGREWGDVPYGALRTILATASLLAGSGEQPGEADRAYAEGRWCGECRYGVVEDPPCCTPAPVVPDSTDERERVRDAIEDGLCLLGSNFLPDDSERIVVATENGLRNATDAVLAVVGQGVTAEQALCEAAAAIRGEWQHRVADEIAHDLELRATRLRAAVRPTGQEQADG